MPKEITHWLIAGKTAEITRGTLLGDAGLAHPNALRLGAVFPDVLYFLSNSPGMSPYRSIAQAYHGHGGEDTYIPLRRLATALPGSPHQSALLAFLAGFACHIQTDATFHPLVYHLTGDYGDADPERRSRAVMDHRRLECLMDMFFCNGAAGLQAHSLKEIVRGLELPFPYLIEELIRREGDLRGLSEPDRAARQALSNFVLLQGLSKRRGLARLLDLVSPVFPRATQEVIALFYSPALDPLLPRLSAPVSYRNPVTGHAAAVLLPELFDRAVTSSADCLREIEKAMHAGASILPAWGPSLSYGFTDQRPARPRYFAETRFFRPDGS